MIKVTFRALVLLFMHGMLRCFDQIENPSRCRSQIRNTSGKYLANLIKNHRCITTCCFIKSGKQQFLHILRSGKALACTGLRRDIHSNNGLQPELGYCRLVSRVKGRMFKTKGQYFLGLKADGLGDGKKWVYFTL